MGMGMEAKAGEGAAEVVAGVARSLVATKVAELAAREGASGTGGWTAGP